MSRISLEAYALMVHEGGTKFYEVALLANKGSDEAIVVRRWGKKSVMDTGGEVMQSPTSMSIAAARSEFDKLVSSKRSRGYTVGPLTPTDWHKHYSTVLISQELRHIVDVLGPEVEDETVEFEDAVPVKPVNYVEPDRGADWGSW